MCTGTGLSVNGDKLMFFMLTHLVDPVDKTLGHLCRFNGTNQPIVGIVYRDTIFKSVELVQPGKLCEMVQKAHQGCDSSWG